MPDLSRTLRAAFTRALNRRTALRRGRVETIAFESAALAAPRTITLYLPPGYDEGDRTYPVLYMQDGQNLFDDARAFAGQSWRIQEAADAAIGDRSARPMIIAGVDHAGTERVNEYTPTRSEEKKAGGGGDQYARLLVDEIKPLIDGRLRTSRDVTCVGGSSLGGLLALHAAVRHPDVFHGVAAMSPSVWWDERRIIAEIAELAGKPRPRIWLDVGGREGREALEDARRLRDELLARGWSDRDLRYYEDRRADHSERAWRARVRKALEFLFPPE